MTISEINHTAEALARLPSQFQTPNTMALVTALVAECQPMELSFLELLLNRGIDTAEDAALDLVGKLVGQARGGLDDDIYRRHIRAKIRANKSSGNVEDLIRVADLVVYDDDVSIRLERRNIATMIVNLEGAAVAAAVADTTIKFLRIAKAGGARVILHSSTAEPARTFRLNAGPGLPAMAKLNFAPITASGFTTIIGLRPGIPDGDTYRFSIVPGAASPAGAISYTAPTHIQYQYKKTGSPNSTIADLEAAVRANAHLRVYQASTVSGNIAGGDELSLYAFIGDTVLGGALAGSRE